MKKIPFIYILILLAVLYGCDISPARSGTSSSSGTIHGIHPQSKALGTSANDEPGGPNTWITPSSSRVVDYQVDIQVTDFPSAPSTTWLYYFALQVDFSQYNEWGHGGIQWAAQPTTQGPPNTNNLVANWGGGSDYAGYGGNGSILQTFSWKTNNWYLYHVSRLNSSSDTGFTGTYYWGFWIEDYTSGATVYLGSIYTKSPYISNAVVFSEIGYGVTNSSPKARVVWRNPNYRDEGSGFVNRPPLGNAGYNNESPIITPTNQELLSLNPAPQWYHSTNETRTIPTGTDLWNYTVPPGGIGNGIFVIVNKYSGKAQKTDSYTGCSLYNYPYAGTGISQWAVIPAGSYYNIVNVATGYTLQAGEYNDVEPEIADNGDDQLFALTPVGGGFFTVGPKLFPGHYWRIQGNYDGNPTQVYTTGVGNSDQYLWQFTAPY